MEIRILISTNYRRRDLKGNLNQLKGCVVQRCVSDVHTIKRRDLKGNLNKLKGCIM
ncbi:hypothetical protein WN51_09609 [Melipona quadrifasciata]|uniref:Uncharacterized protein n=1 Tax=Melipona quadrifasciata TaxID=166423 RepID=A0A0M9A6I6_9HYME|nr:hypothetical protein WN51_09609 [Melipona quadrifasciata]